MADIDKTPDTILPKIIINHKYQCLHIVVW